MHPKSANHERKNQVRGFEGKIICEKTLTPILSKTTRSRVSYLKRMKFKIWLKSKMQVKYYLFPRESRSAFLRKRNLKKRCWQGFIILLRYKTLRRRKASNKLVLWKLNKVSQCAGSIFESKQISEVNSQAIIWSRLKRLIFKMRVWSWLRTNAGGVPNTCKSSELNSRIPSGWFVGRERRMGE